MAPRGPLAALALALVVAATGCQAGSGDPAADAPSATPSAEESPTGSASPEGTATEEPPGGSGAWLGASVDWTQDSLRGFADRLGRSPAVAVSFYSLPLTPEDRSALADHAGQAREVGAALMVTVEPKAGLAAVTPEVAADLGAALAEQEAAGTDLMLRFAHEMNGSWYAWGQQPTAYVEAFRRVAAAVRDAAPGTAMVWAPNYGGGYPFPYGASVAQPGSAEAAVLDTDGDGSVTAADDPYAPYWPGREHVDWVGMSVYHWGSAYPWGENELPEPGKFTAQLRGTYVGAAGDEQAVPDFYAEYGEAQGLPVAVTETGAFYAPGRGGAEELAVKQAWWRQVFAEEVPRSMPALRLVNWFDWGKVEPEAGGYVDWRVTQGPVGEAFRAELPGWLRTDPLPDELG